MGHRKAKWNHFSRSNVGTIEGVMSCKGKKIWRQNWFLVQKYFLVKILSQGTNKRAVVWHSWQYGSFQYQRTRVQIQLLVNNYFLITVCREDEIKEKGGREFLSRNDQKRNCFYLWNCSAVGKGYLFHPMQLLPSHLRRRRRDDW